MVALSGSRRRGEPCPMTKHATPSKESSYSHVPARWMRRAARSVLVRADDFATGPSAQCPVSQERDTALDELDRAIPLREIHATGMKATEGELSPVCAGIVRTGRRRRPIGHRVGEGPVCEAQGSQSSGQVRRRIGLGDRGEEPRKSVIVRPVGCTGPRRPDPPAGRIIEIKVRPRRLVDEPCRFANNSVLLVPSVTDAMGMAQVALKMPSDGPWLHVLAYMLPAIGGWTLRPAQL